MEQPWRRRSPADPNFAAEISISYIGGLPLAGGDLTARLQNDFLIFGGVGEIHFLFGASSTRVAKEPRRCGALSPFPFSPSPLGPGPKVGKRQLE